VPLQVVGRHLPAVLELDHDPGEFPEELGPGYAELAGGPPDGDDIGKSRRRFAFEALECSQLFLDQHGGERGHAGDHDGSDLRVSSPTILSDRIGAEFSEAITGALENLETKLQLLEDRIIKSGGT